MIFTTTNPYTGTKIAEYTADSSEQIEEKLARASKEQPQWAALSFDERGNLMRLLAGYLRQHKPELARLITTEMGKILTESAAEIEKCAGQCAYYAEHAAQLLGDEIVLTEAQNSRVVQEPVGVVLAIMPWNFPFWQVFRYAIPALMAGNVTLLKPAPNTLACGLAIAEAFRSVGFPEGVFQCLIVDVDVIENLLADDRVGMVTLTGSERAGSSVASLAGRNIKKSVLELGGSDAFIVLADADIEQAAKAAVQSRMGNAGQVCIAAKRFLVEKSVKADFTARVKIGIEAIRQGDPTDPTTQMGPLARLDLAEALEHQLQQALQQGVTLLVGGTRNGANFAPTLLDHVTPDCAVFQEETFGPLATITEVRDADEALQLANQSRYGLSATIWTGDMNRAAELSRKLQVGSVFVNAVVRSDSRLPIGGVKKSGYGRELSKAGIRDFCVTKTIWIG